MSPYRKHMIRSIGNRLAEISGKNIAMYGVPLELRPSCRRLLLDIAGGTLEVVDHLPAVVLANGHIVSGSGDDDITREAIARGLDRWMSTGEAPLDIARALPLASGAERIAEALGANIDRMCALAYAAHSATFEATDKNVNFSIRKIDQRFHATYRNGSMRWRNGVVTLRSKRIPDIMRMALKGRALSSVVNDGNIGGHEIRQVVNADVREGLLRVHTIDAGKFI